MSKRAKLTVALALLLFAAAPAMAQGRLPSDPATMGDIWNTDVRLSNAVNDLRTGQSATNAAMNARIDNLEAKVADADKMKMFVETGVRVYDAKRVRVDLFNSFDAAGAKEVGAGVRMTLKLGKSYEEKLIDAQRKQIEALLRKLEAAN